MASRTFDQDSFQLVKRMVHLFASVSITEASPPVPTLQRWVYPTFGMGVNARTYIAAVTAAGLPSGAAYPRQYQSGSEGVLSIARTATGLYTLTLQDKYQRLIGLEAYGASASGTGTLFARLNENTTITDMDADPGSIIGLAFLDGSNAVIDPIGSVRLHLILADATEP